MKNALKYKIWLEKKSELNYLADFYWQGEQMRKRKHIAPTYEEDKLKGAVHQRGMPTLRPHVATCESNMYLFYK